MKANKGFTLIEIAVVLAIIAILAAILTPIVTSYIDQARVTRASADVKKIAEAALLYKRDTGVWPGYTASHLSDAIANNGTGLADCLRSDGVQTSGAQGSNPSLQASLVTFCLTTTVDMQTALNVNVLNFTAGGAGPSGGQTAFRGPYLDGLGGVDPWGTPYIVTSHNFATTGPGSYAFAASAGPNTTFDLGLSQARNLAFTVSGTDDLASVIH